MCAFVYVCMLLFSLIYFPFPTSPLSLPLHLCPLSSSRYIIYETSADGKQTSIHRQFLLDSDGKILEIFSDFKRKRAQQRAFNLDKNEGEVGGKGKEAEVGEEEDEGEGEDEKERGDNDNDDGDDVGDGEDSGNGREGDDPPNLPRRSPRTSHHDHSEEDAHRFARNSYDDEDNFDVHSEEGRGGIHVEQPLAPRSIKKAYS